MSGKLTDLCAFICQISENDWLVSREKGIYGNREGSEREDEVVFFAKTPRGEGTIQSIIEDLIGMRKDDLVFFHVIARQSGESSIHGVYSVTEAPFYNDTTEIWKTSTHFVFPYRFCFGPHAEHTELCENDVNIGLSEFYRMIESRRLRSISTLERESRGAAHSVKKISLDDALEITRALHGAFHLKEGDPVKFKPIDIAPKQPLSQHIRRVGRIEFAVKALAAHRLALRDPELVKHIPACRERYEFLIETFVGQTARKPTDIFIECNRDGKTAVTILEAKVDLANMMDLAQALKYQEIFKLRNIDRGSLGYNMSTCLLAQRFDKDLISYSFTRNRVLPHEEVVLLKYVPNKNGTNAEFLNQKLELLESGKNNAYRVISSKAPLPDLSSDPSKFCSIFAEKRFSSRTSLELKSHENNTIILRKFYADKDERTCLSHILVHDVQGCCGVPELREFMSLVKKETGCQGHFIVVEPMLLASDYDDEAELFIANYNACDTQTGRHPISAYIHLTTRGSA
jgi:hypothetical protein